MNNILICPIYLCVPWNAIKTVINLSECWVPLRLNNRGRQLFSSAGHVTGGHLNRWKRGLKHFRNTGWGTWIKVLASHLDKSSICRNLCHAPVWRRIWWRRHFQKTFLSVQFHFSTNECTFVWTRCIKIQKQRVFSISRIGVMMHLYIRIAAGKVEKRRVNVDQHSYFV